MFSIFSSIIYLGSLSLLLLDAYKSFNTVQNVLRVSSRSVAIIAILLLVYLRWKHTEKLPRSLSLLNSFFIFPISLVCSILLTAYDYGTPPNHAFSLIPIQYTQLAIISIFSLVIGLIQFDDSRLSKYFSFILFSLFFVIFGYAYLATYFPFDVFYNISKEDELFENAQFICLFVSSFISVLIAHRMRMMKMHFIIFLGIALTLFLVAMDEISWGQRMLHFQTPSFFLERNEQEELTIHNLSTFSGFVSIGYITIGLYGSLSPLTRIVGSTFRKIPFMLYVASWSSVPYFFFGFLFNFYNRMVEYHPYAVWSEFAELMIYCGILVTLIEKYRSIKKMTFPLSQTPLKVRADDE